MARRQLQPPQPGLFSNKYHIATLSLGRGGRGHQYTYGLNHVIKESAGNATTVTSSLDVDNLAEPFTLVSLTSPMDIYEIIKIRRKGKRTTRLVAGGQGVYPFKPLTSVCDSIFFGRAEGACDEIITGSLDKYQWNTGDDSLRRYNIRQAQRLLPGESTVGCAGKCTFCQYSATRDLIGKDYHPSKLGYKVTEDRWRDVIPKTGNQTTALDGMSATTRKRVRKGVSDEEIVEKLNEILMSIEGTMRLKVFQIVGYPWETLSSVTEDVKRFSNLLGRVESGNGRSRIMMMVTVTPFSPEPLTAMHDQPGNVHDNWRDIFVSDRYKCIIDTPHINAFYLPQIAGPLTLYKRIAANRLECPDTLMQIYKAKDIDQAIGIGGDIFAEGRGYLHDYLSK